MISRIDWHARNFRLANSKRRLAFLIDEKYQRRGFARAAIQELIRCLKENYECEKLTLGHRPENRGAEVLYTSLGFEVVDVTDREVIRSIVIP